MRTDADVSTGCTRAGAGLVELIVTSRTQPRHQTARARGFAIQGRKRKLAKLRRTVRAAFQCHAETSLATDRTVFITLTYSSGVEPGKRDIPEFIGRLRQWLRRRGVHPLRYVWVREDGANGDYHGTHYHVVVWLPCCIQLPKPDEAGWWKHGSSSIGAVRDLGGTCGYLMKFRTKAGQGRLFGVGGITATQRARYRLLCAPNYVQQAFPNGADPIRIKGGGFVDCETGEIANSPFVCVDRGDGKGLVYERR